MRRGTARKLVHGRDRRRWMGLADDEQVAATWVGPPEVPLDRRGSILQSCRQLLEEHGHQLARARSGTARLGIWRRTDPVELTGAQAHQALVSDEESAEGDGHWWLHDALWTATNPLRNIHAGVDLDGNDLGWTCWGDPSAAETVARLENLLLAGDAGLTPPLFAFSDGVDSFDSVRALLGYIEPVDVSPDLVVFDSTGRVLKLLAVGLHRGRRTVGGGATIVDRRESPALDEMALASLLRDHATTLTSDEGVDVARMTLPELVEFVHPRTRCG